MKVLDDASPVIMVGCAFICDLQPGVCGVVLLVIFGAHCVPCIPRQLPSKQCIKTGCAASSAGQTLQSIHNEYWSRLQSGVYTTKHTSSYACVLTEAEVWLRWAHLVSPLFKEVCIAIKVTMGGSGTSATGREGAFIPEMGPLAAICQLWVALEACKEVGGAALGHPNDLKVGDAPELTEQV